MKPGNKSTRSVDPWAHRHYTLQDHRSGFSSWDVLNLFYYKDKTWHPWDMPCSNVMRDDRETSDAMSNSLQAAAPHHTQHRSLQLSSRAVGSSSLATGAQVK